MKATLTFDLPDDEENFHIAIQARDLHSAIWDFSRWLRTVGKHGEVESLPLSEVSEKFYDILRERGIEL